MRLVHLFLQLVFFDINKTLNTVKSQAVEQSTIQFWSKAIVHKHQINSLKILECARTVYSENLEKKYVVLDSSKKRTLGQFSVHKIAPVFIFWKNPGRHDLLLRFTKPFCLQLYGTHFQLDFFLEHIFREDFFQEVSYKYIFFQEHLSKEHLFRNLNLHNQAILRF